MKHFVLGYPDSNRKGAVSVLYAGDSRAAARDALFVGAEGVVVADYVCNPQVSQSKRFPAKSAAQREKVVESPPEDVTTAPIKPDVPPPAVPEKAAAVAEKIGLPSKSRSIAAAAEKADG